MARAHEAGRSLRSSRIWRAGLRRLRLAAAMLAVCLGGRLEAAGHLEAAGAAETLPSQSEVESVYLYDFTKFVRWPAGAGEGTIRICVAAPPAFSAALEKTVAGEQVAGRALEVRRITQPEEEDGCAILFIESQRERAGELLRGAVAKPMLTVSDAPDFLDRGGMIQFEVVQHRVRFSVNLNAVSRGNLAMSSELLKVAHSVRGSAPAGGGQ